ncbi:MAG: tungstate ABC transporter substrate-binding protein WtpA [Phycisphaerae bacterium]|nr:tungstate ABC transporter substrate-binding protein WtpA [Phycisphaerae bacterium]NIP53327.1 tungstate ABC transporter substrate-binding protein WtpA [Phycisphaerae bacterium]NIS49962.1 tungstate ABC transporter substrate-binding protein WtpA [Phycisphaerae bacterium]NIU07666.1 tungstate ABC transporter substrate-binding protein WtpA [Phycisphaerae bacterium]NIU57531.1 tungstate ABC transporter substrate-binding protein WtpA [Phycisphaerae bacterium]
MVLVGFAVRSSRLRASSQSNSQKLIIFHAGSLAVPFKQICEEFNKHHPDVTIIREAAGSRVCARKIADLHRLCDILASADYTVIDTLLIPEYTDWNIKFAANEIVIAFLEKSHAAGQINKDNWHEFLLQKDITFGRSDPNADPCGYRAVITIKLAEKFYNSDGLVDKMLAKDQKYIRPKEVDLLALLETGEVDYMFIYRSVAEQHKLKYILLPDEINLKKTNYRDLYKSASVEITGSKPGTFITKFGEPIVYGVTIPKNAPNRELAMEFMAFLLDSDKGGAILEKNGQSSVVPSPTDTFGNLPESLKTFAFPM